ncbi:MarR family winged helix-turn-helix transcriptional regulator [Intestinimonas butyriciproducens]|uniref:MarR family winged helix-turn-helix transcriptional regulator n=1 Tax=Intestinimonas butyriciproducens TaxID=1297617 RepID=UPI0018AA1044|nr:MarR family transcriptional regulator [Intestinimonas butyriciproducens]
MSESTYLGQNISIAYRLSNRFYDRVLSPYQIGCGQQFFLLRIYENQGISMYDLARMGRFDKGTVTRAVQKLEEQGYVRCVPDERDKRVRRLYTTDMVEPIAKAVNEARKQWNEYLTRGMTPEETEMARTLLNRIAENAMSAVEREERET